MMTPDNEVLLVCKCGKPATCLPEGPLDEWVCEDCATPLKPALADLTLALDEAEEEGPAAVRDFERQLRKNHERFQRQLHGRHGRR